MFMFIQLQKYIYFYKREIFFNIVVFFFLFLFLVIFIKFGLINTGIMVISNGVDSPRIMMPGEAEYISKKVIAANQLPVKRIKENVEDIYDKPIKIFVIISCICALICIIVVPMLTDD